MIVSPDDIAEQIQNAFDRGDQIDPPSSKSTLSVEDGYRISAALRARRLARGARLAGRKIGFTNRSIWPTYGVDRPMWGEMYDTTLVEAGQGPLDLSQYLEPRIEPEIAFGLATVPNVKMTEAELLSCCAWVAHGFEIVQSPYPGWQFSTGDAIAAGALHGAYVIGPRVAVEQVSIEALHNLSCTLFIDGEIKESGSGSNVLDGPVSALTALVHGLAADSSSSPLSIGEIITTGTMTDAYPIAPGESWTTKIMGAPIAGLTIEFA